MLLPSSSPVLACCEKRLRHDEFKAELAAGQGIENLTEHEGVWLWDRVF